MQTWTPDSAALLTMRAQRFIGMVPAEVNIISAYIAGGEGAFHWPTQGVRYSFLHELGTQVQLLLNRLGIHSYTIGKPLPPPPWEGRDCGVSSAEDNSENQVSCTVLEAWACLAWFRLGKDGSSILHSMSKVLTAQGESDLASGSRCNECTLKAAKLRCSYLPLPLAPLLSTLYKDRLNFYLGV